MAKNDFLLIDADVLAYQSAASVERVICWEDDLCMPVGSIEEGLARFEEKLASVCDLLETDQYALCFSCSAKDNFRRRLYPQYKANRDGKPHPVVLSFLRNRLISQEYRGVIQMLPSLEADDVLGILATSPAYKAECRKIIVSVDKDMKTLPCNFFDLNKGVDADGNVHITEIPIESADYWFMTQSLTGDTTDGYPGCPKYGPSTAAKLFQKRMAEVLADASNDGSDTIGTLWPAVIEAYAKAGFGEEYALTMARLARILRADDWYFKEQKVKLWEPK